MNAVELPVRRPVATSMFFLGMVILGWIAWQRIPVELFPRVEGNELHVNFFRPGSDPELVEREILLPLQARVQELPDVEETWGEIRGAGGTFRVRFAAGSDLQVRELDLNRLTAELSRDQPPGTTIVAELDPFTRLIGSGFAMFIQVTGMEDRDALLDFVDERVVPRLAAVPGVSQVLATGGAPRELTVRVDPDRCAAYGVTPEQVNAAIARSVQRLNFLGGADGAAGRTAVVLDGRPRGVVSVGEIRIVPEREARIRHVADIELGVGRQESDYRVDGRPAVGLILFQEEGANLVRLSRDMGERLELLQQEFALYQLGFDVSFDGGAVVGQQVDRLQRLAATGFLVALAVLYLFLRQWRAVGAVGLAVPTSLFCALTLLFVAGQTINVITLFGLAVGIGMLVDNSIVVYEAVQRQLERGYRAEAAAAEGVRRTIRAILASTATNAVVFLPITFVDFDQAMLRSVLQVLVVAILLPLVGSVLVAVGLVPLLARHLAAPAAAARLREHRRRRARLAGWSPPDRVRELFGGALVGALRRPGGWIIAVSAAVLVTLLIALPLVTLTTVGQEPPETSQVQFPLELDGSGSLEASGEAFRRLELAAQEVEGVDRVESFIQEEGGTLTVHLLPKDERPPGMNAASVRAAVRSEARRIDRPQVEIVTQDSGGGGDVAALFGQGASSAIVSGPESAQLQRLAERIKQTLGNIDEVQSPRVTSRASQDEIRVAPEALPLEGFGLTADQVLPVLSVVRREGATMRTGFSLPSGREIPLTVRRVENDAPSAANADLTRLRMETPSGVLPLGAVATVRKMPPPPTIVHHNGRRELEVQYTLAADAPESGPARTALEAQIREAIVSVGRPAGYTVEAPQPEETVAWFKQVLVPVILLLFAVLAITFESLTMPVLVLLTLPLTLLGAVWALVVADMPADPMALVGAVALIGLTVNPAILLVDRMQQRAKGRSAGAAALIAVRERARPVLMTATTSVAGLWPLALSTGQENEIWPPFATIVMGGLITSTLLTLLVIPVGFVFLHRLDRLFGRLGPWIVLVWLGVSTALLWPLFAYGIVVSTTAQILATLLIAGLLLALAVLAFRRTRLPEPAAADGPPAIEVRYLTKTYGLPGPIGKAWGSTRRFIERVLRDGGQVFDPGAERGRIVPQLVVLAGAAYLAMTLDGFFWRTVATFVAAGLAGAVLLTIRRWRGHGDARGRTLPGGIEGLLAALLPWLACAWLLADLWALPKFFPEADGWWPPQPQIRLWLVIALPLVVGVVQTGRRTARRLSRGEIELAPKQGALRFVRGGWRRFSRTLFGLDLPRSEIRALSYVHFRAEQGMIGVLGPNGAGKTTMLRLLAGILDPSVGTVHVGGVAVSRLRKYLARWIGYLPQDFGLPGDLTAREYLEYFALLYEIRPEQERKERVQRLIEEVGLAEKADQKIGGFSGGQRQRVAVARTLLRLPPIIIVDEPTVGLDPRERIRFRNLLAKLSEGRVVLFSTHVVEDVEVACERVIVMAGGRKVFDGEPSRLSEVADGKVWELRLLPDEVENLSRQAIVADEVPELSGTVRLRVLSDVAPDPSATALPPSLEDGYLWLVEGGGRDAAVA